MHVVQRAVVVGVGAAQDAPLAPRNDEQHALALGDHHGVGHVQTLPVDHQMNALCQSQSHAAVGKRRRPWPAGIDHRAGENPMRSIGKRVAKLAFPAVFAGNGRFQAQIVGDDRPMAGGGAQRVDHQPGVVALRIEIPHRAGKIVGIQVPAPGRAFRRRSCRTKAPDSARRKADRKFSRRSAISKTAIA